MSKYVITLTKSEIETAVLRYVNREVTIYGRRELKEPSVYFRDNNGALGYIEADITVDSSAMSEALQPEREE